VIVFSFVGETNDWGTVNFGQTMANYLQKWLLTKVDTLIVMATVRCFLHFRCATGWMDSSLFLFILYVKSPWGNQLGSLRNPTATRFCQSLVKNQRTLVISAVQLRFRQVWCWELGHAGHAEKPRGWWILWQSVRRVCARHRREDEERQILRRSDTLKQKLHFLQDIATFGIWHV
jgi:hypothetical protein